MAGAAIRDQLARLLACWAAHRSKVLDATEVPARASSTRPPVKPTAAPAPKGLLTIVIANTIVLAPMVLNGHPGTKYGERPTSVTGSGADAPPRGGARPSGPVAAGRRSHTQQREAAGSALCGLRNLLPSPPAESAAPLPPLLCPLPAGVPFPVLARASFGLWGANIPSVLRALVACGWFGIQTWVGGGAIFALINNVTGNLLPTTPLPFVGISAGELFCFYTFWAAQVLIIVRGIESIKVVEQYSAPVLILLSAALFAWAIGTAGGFGPMLSSAPN